MAQRSWTLEEVGRTACAIGGGTSPCVGRIPWHMGNAKEQVFGNEEHTW